MNVPESSDGEPWQVSLQDDEAHLWYALTDEIQNPHLLDAYQALMSEEERARHQRFMFEKDRHRFLITRALVRTLLSRYHPLRPESWQFEAGRYGRPSIIEPRLPRPLEFNLSHTPGMVVCLVAWDREIGVDVEDIQRRAAGMRVAEHYFAAEEVAQLQAMPEAAQAEAFFDFWTLKESYIKAVGRGLSLPLKQFAFHLEANQPVRITFTGTLDDDPRSWQFTQYRPTPRHKIAVALRRRDAEAISIVIRKTIPRPREV